MILNEKKLLPLLGLIILLLILVIGWLGFAFIDEKEERAGERKLNATQFTYQNSLIKTQKDSLGRLISTLKITEATKEQVQGVVLIQDNFIKRTLLELAASAKEQKQITDNLSGSVKNLKQVTNLKIESNADILTILRDTVMEGILMKNIKDSIRIDTQRVYARTFNFTEKDGWFKVSGLVTQDSISISLKEWKDELLKADYRKPADRPRLVPWFLRKKVTITKVKNLNPYSSLKDFQQLDVKK